MDAFYWRENEIMISLSGAKRKVAYKVGTGSAH